MKYFVTLTGGKNNAGDFLIKHRAHSLLSKLRPDRALKDFDAWRLIDEEKLEVINNSEALLLTGGPSLQKNMYPGIYNLGDDLDKIKVPIISLGIGWKSLNGDWKDIENYPMSSTSMTLIKKMGEHSYNNSVRDYHTMHVLQNFGVSNVRMTGCPALYDSDFIETPLQSGAQKKVKFSLGVGFIKSKRMNEVFKKLILSLNKRFEQSDYEVIFHHSVSSSFLKTPGASKKLYLKNVEFLDWLKENGIKYRDISGSAENLMDCYKDCDLHIGYRVHAHIFMTSISKPSILIAEDGRGKALRSVIGGLIFDGYTSHLDSILHKLLFRLNIQLDPFVIDYDLVDLIEKSIEAEVDQGLPRMNSVMKLRNNHYEVMKSYIEQLP
ncbi:MAG: hypothetical protein ACI8Q1_000831 [Parvicella sp.]|jgi:hypothetical protein